MKTVTEIKPISQQPVKRKLRVAAYCRVSTSSAAQHESLETQKSHYEAYINSQPNWELTDIYYDEGITGTKAYQRPALQRMLRDCESRKVDLILTKSISRLSRNVTDCLEIVRKLQDLNIGIYFEKENLNTSHMEGELILSVMGALAESESDLQGENIRWSIRKRFENGTYKLSYPPYGYTWTGNNLLIHPKQAKIVQEIFTRFVAGDTVTKIVHDLNSRKIILRRAKQWNHHTITYILRNEKYTGDALFQKTYTDTRLKKRAVNNQDVAQYLYQGHHEAIISHELYEQAQALINQHALEKNIPVGLKKTNKHYAFSGKIICGSCGAKLRRRTHDSTGNTYIAWVCNTHIKNPSDCPLLYIRNDVLEAAFTTMLNKLIYGYKTILIPLQDKMCIQCENDNIQRMRELETELLTIADKKHTLEKLVGQGYIDNLVFVQQEAELAAQRARIATELDGLRKTDAATEINELRKLLEFTRQTPMLSSFNENYFSEYATSITIYSRQEIGIRLKCGLLLRERISQ